jgi:SnoaL-like protein
MSTTDPVDRYYDAWAHRHGDMTDVPLADQFRFSGPIASFDTAAGYRDMAAQAGPMVRSFRVRHQFRDGNMVFSLIDWEMAGVPGTLTAAELLEVEADRLVRGELIYDAEDLRKAMTS